MADKGESHACARKAPSDEPLRVLEFYSGIGGMHAALQLADPTAKVIRAFDINDTANKVYRHNFPGTPVWQRLIESIPREQFEGKLHADMYLMSPPCQPFTRTGKRQGIADKRSTSLRFILDLITTMNDPPRYIVVENVKGFETSNAREPLTAALSSRDYAFQEFILSPDQFGIPNSRLRYFLVAVRAPLRLPSSPTGTVLYHIPTVAGSFSGEYNEETAKRHFVPPAPKQVPGVPPARPWITRPVSSVGDFISAIPAERDANIIPMKVVLRHGQLFDIVDATSRRTMCFTKAYSHYAEGTGSVVLGAEGTSLEGCARVFAEVEAQAAEKQRRKQAKQSSGSNSEERPGKQAQATTLAEAPRGAEGQRGDQEEKEHQEKGRQQLHERQHDQQQQEQTRGCRRAGVAEERREDNNASGGGEVKLSALRLRWFTPQEMLRLHGFPSSYEVPSSVTPKQMRRCIGNSLNVVVVGELIKYALASTKKAAGSSSSSNDSRPATTTHAVNVSEKR